ncbi:hypothetical protein LINPERHAP1_LOCUS1467 [Linum perenne]
MKMTLTHQHELEVLDVRELRSQDWTILVRHIYREGNHAVDHPASRCFSLSLDCHVITNSDCNLEYFFFLL